MTDGVCHLCEETYTKRGMTRHLGSCLPDTNDRGTYHLRIAGERRSDYWLHLAVAETTPLSTLDGFLRDLWVECCNHLSAFSIDDQRYERPYDDDGMGGVNRSQSMDIELGSVAATVDSFSYTYDFDSETALDVRVVETGDWSIPELEADGTETDYEEVVLLARNHQPDIDCEACGAPATTICQTCLRDRGADAWLCESCASTHEDDCDRPRYLPVVNSPRVGVCGYRGPATVGSES